MQKIMLALAAALIASTAAAYETGLCKEGSDYLERLREVGVPLSQRESAVPTLRVACKDEGQLTQLRELIGRYDYVGDVRRAKERKSEEDRKQVKPAKTINLWD